MKEEMKNLTMEADDFLKKNGYRWNGQVKAKVSQSVWAIAQAGSPGTGKRG